MSKDKIIDNENYLTNEIFKLKRRLKQLRDLVWDSAVLDVDLQKNHINDLIDQITLGESIEQLELTVENIKISNDQLRQLLSKGKHLTEEVKHISTPYGNFEKLDGDIDD